MRTLRSRTRAGYTCTQVHVTYMHQRRSERPERRTELKVWIMQNGDHQQKGLTQMQTSTLTKHVRGRLVDVIEHAKSLACKASINGERQLQYELIKLGMLNTRDNVQKMQYDRLAERLCRDS